MRKISTEIGSLAHFVGEEKAIEMYAKAGFDCFDMSLIAMVKWDHRNHCPQAVQDNPFAGRSWRKYAYHLRDVATANHIECNQAHAPFPTAAPEVKRRIKRAIECAAIVGAKIIVIHPDNNKSPKQNRRLLKPFVEYAKTFGLKVATENMWNWEKGAPNSCPAACSTFKSFVEHIDMMADPSFGACLDFGHAEMKGSGDGAANMVRALGKRLICVHIHDNDCLRDLHELPFTDKIDFKAIADALNDIGYKGEVTLEADSHHWNHKDSLEQNVKDLYESAKKFASMLKD